MTRRAGAVGATGTEAASGTMESVRTAALAATAGLSLVHGQKLTGYIGGKGAGLGTVRKGAKDGHAS
jgi:hypothetical protein